MKSKTIFTALPILILLMVASVNSTQAQGIVQEGIKPMSQGDKNCFYIELPTTNNKLAADVWEDFIKNYKGKTKTDRKSKEIFTDDAVIKEMSENTVDVYARADEGTLTVWFDLGGAYLSSAQHANRYPAVEEMLNAYYYDLTKGLAKADLESKEAELKSLEKELKKLEDENKKLNETIEKARETIAKAEAEIAGNIEMQGAKKNEIDVKATEVEAAKEHLNFFGKKYKN